MCVRNIMGMGYVVAVGREWGGEKLAVEHKNCSFGVCV